MSGCEHRSITRYAAADAAFGVPSIWACDDCKLRFYPACRECVDVGHRNGHPSATDAATDEAEREWSQKLPDGVPKG